MLMSLPLAVAFSALGENAPDIVVHVVLGTGMLLFVRAVFDFALPRWINVIGAVSAGAFAVVFLYRRSAVSFPRTPPWTTSPSGCFGDSNAISDHEYNVSATALTSGVRGLIIALPQERVQSYFWLNSGGTTPRRPCSPPGTYWTRRSRRSGPP